MQLSSYTPKKIAPPSIIISTLGTKPANNLQKKDTAKIINTGQRKCDQLKREKSHLYQKKSILCPKFTLTHYNGEEEDRKKIQRVINHLYVAVQDNNAICRKS